MSLRKKNIDQWWIICLPQNLSNFLILRYLKGKCFMHDLQLQRFCYALKAFKNICNAKLAADIFLARDHHSVWLLNGKEHSALNKTDRPLYHSMWKHSLHRTLGPYIHINSARKCSNLLSKFDSYSSLFLWTSPKCPLNISKLEAIL